MGDTVDDSTATRSTRDRATPGVVFAFSGKSPTYAACALRDDRLILGREHPAMEHDERASRRHAELSHDGARWTIADLSSRNGTWVDGARIADALRVERPRVVRVGRTLVLPVDDVRPYLEDRVVVGRHRDRVDGEHVEGPILRGALSRIAQVAGTGDNLLVVGETGAGKEGAARAFHASGAAARGPIVTANCAAIPEGVAESLLFGARKGAYSGATEAEGLVAAADRGVLFLDEIGELALDVQAKLLRVLETKEVVPLGGTSARKIDVRFCFATHRDLRAAVAAGRFRADLFHRVAQPSVRLPPLRERREEIPFLLASAIRSVRGDLSPHTSLVEAAIARPWPGNVRELLHHARAAAHAAVAARAEVVGVEHLDAEAGALDDAPESSPDRTSRESIERALRAESGNVAAAARSLGLHRTQLYRLLKRFGLASPREV